MVNDLAGTTNQRTIELSNLEFDHQNPRLPEWVERDEQKIFEHILEYYALDELIDSFLDNGYFEAERLIVIESEFTPGNYIVVEGNRRLAALKYLKEQFDATPDSVQVIPKDLSDELSHIPCLIVQSREEINTYLAYRHIGGMKTWGAEAKARFVLRMTKELIAKGDSDPFRTIGKK